MKIKILISLAALVIFPLASIALAIFYDRIFESGFFKELGALGWFILFGLTGVAIGICACLLTFFHAKIPYLANKPLLAIHFALLIIMSASYFFFIEAHSPFSFLYRLASRGHFNICRLLINLGADINYRSPLEQAARKREYELVKFFLDQGADVTVNDQGSHALYYTNIDNNIKATQLLLDHHVDACYLLNSAHPLTAEMKELLLKYCVTNPP